MKKIIKYLFVVLLIHSITIRVFGLTLDECIKLTLENNYKIQARSYEVDAKKKVIDVERSEYFPEVRAGTDYGAIPFKSQGLFGSSRTKRHNIRLRTEQPLWRAGYIKAKVKKAYWESNIAKAEKDIEEVDVVYDVTKAYYNVILQKEIVAVHQESVENAVGHVDSVREKVKEDMAVEVDLLVANTSLSSEKAELFTARNDYNIAMQELNLIMGNELEKPLDIEEQLVFKPVEIDHPSLVHQAFGENPHLEKNYAQSQAAEQARKAAKSGFFPHVKLFTQWEWGETQGKPANRRHGDAGGEADLPLLPTGYNYAFGVGISVPILKDYIEAKARYREAKAIKNKLVMAKSHIENSIRLNINKARSKISESEMNYEVAKSNVDVFTKRLENIKKGYEEGVFTSLDVSDAHKDLSNAKIKLLKSIYKYNMAYTNLKKVVGKTH
ncbi:MAG: outer membrane protein [Candidatus Scalindua rubra]|uniref:Outer membrane protein n=1 Tax=Candidatus Scalindua rubra TaxID=1872076 RepID=A0A1E3XFA1_9BACT|nr:MAG: outer membrane protein [Candidatus Scalindua rubra]